MAKSAYIKGPKSEGNVTKNYYPTHVDYVEGLYREITEVIKYNEVVGDKLEKDANAVSATKLKDTVTLQTDLESTSSVDFDGTKNVLIGVKGTLPVTSGGTGKTNLSNVTVGAASKATLDSAGNNISEFFAPVSNPELKGTPQSVTVTDLDDDSDKIATTAFVAAIIRRLMGATPETLNTLQELAVAVNQDPNFATTVATQLDGKQDKHAALTSISGLTTSTNKMIYTSASNVYATTALTAFARTLLDDTDAETARNTLGILSQEETSESFTPRPVSKSISIPVSGWKLDSAETSDYKYYYEISVTDLLAEDIVEVFYSRGSISTVLEAGICPSDNETETGKFKIWAAAIPTSPINATYVVWKG